MATYHGAPAVAASGTGLPLHVVEDHNHALEHIYRAIGRKKLPFSGTCLVHFDAHPDLLAPEGMPAEVVYSKEELFGCLGIADWILPAIYAGHFGSVVWLKPTWSEQIPDGLYQLTVGRHKEDGLIKLSLVHNMTLARASRASYSELQNISERSKRRATLELAQVQLERRQRQRRRGPSNQIAENFDVTSGTW